MEQLQEILAEFFTRAESDPRIGMSHISLYCALLKYGFSHIDNGAIPINSTELMKVAKISGLGTYHKCIRDLHDFGYVKYHPSYNHRKKSKVLLLQRK